MGPNGKRSQGASARAAFRGTRWILVRASNDFVPYNRVMRRIEESRPQEAEFATTHWSVVLSAGKDASPADREALATLCETYWYPLYAYVRRRGYQTHDARDLVQEFFASLLEKDWLRVADPARGRFRCFLLTACNHFLSNRRRHAAAQIRGGRWPALSLDFETAEQRYQFEPAVETTPERLYERRWAMTLLDRALERLRELYTCTGKQAVYHELKSYLGSTAPQARYDELAQRLKMSPAAVKVAVHRLRRRCREVLRQEIEQTVERPEDVDDELRALFSAVQT
jgi:RNA polymerase sigma factor (sigma-70 family)